MTKPEIKTKESEINDLLSDCYSEDQAVEEFYYLTVKGRGKHTTEKAIRIAHRNRKLGTLLKKHDSILFYTT
jgi:hypothetical protein